MIKKFLLDILVAPVTKNKLEYNTAESLLEDPIGGDKYPVVNFVPVLLPLLPNPQKKESVFHREHKSSFDYTAHYKNDAAYYDYFEDDKTLASRNETKRYRQAVLQKVPPNTKILLDVGCGGAYVAQHFTPKGVQVVSMDISLKNPLKALEKIPGPGHAALVADAYFIPVKENAFDVIIASAVMEHLYDPKLFISQLLNIVRPGGKIILLTPYNEKIHYHICVHCNKPTPENAHLYSFNEANIQTFLPTAGIRVKTANFSNKYFVKLRLYNFTGFLSYSLWRTLDKLANKLFFKPAYFLIEIEKR